MNRNAKKPSNINRLSAASLLFTSLTLVATGAQADILNLDFTVYTTEAAFNSAIVYYTNNPLVSDFQISLDTTTLNNSATTNAYSNNPSYTEIVTTSVTDGQNQSFYQVPSSYANVAVSQVYTQNQTAQGVSSQMSLGGNFTVNSESYPVISQDYTGNLPPSLIPATGSQPNVLVYNWTNISWNTILGASPSFVVYDGASLTSLFESMIGNSFYFNQNENSYLCTQLTSYGCAGNQISIGNNNAYGYAVLSAVTTGPIINAASAVPVPAAAWLFAAGMGFLGYTQRRKAVR